MTGRRGFTLVEAVISLAVLSVLVLAIGSAVVLAARALPNPQDAPVQATAAASGVDRLLEDLSFATRLTSRSDWGVTLLVPDRNGDGVPESIRYEWSADGTPGAAGDPVRRRVEGGLPVVLLPDASLLRFTWQIEDVSEAYAGPTLESGERILDTHDPPVVGPISDLDGQFNAIGQFLVPASAPGELGYRITGLSLPLGGKGSATGEAYARWRQPDPAGRPLGATLDEAIVRETDLQAGGIRWERVEFANVPWFTSGTPVTWMLEHKSGSGAALSYAWDDTGGSGRSWAETDDDDGRVWTTDAGTSHRFIVHGHVRARGSGQLAWSQVARRVRVQLHPSDRSSTQISTARRLLNQPLVLDTFWITDFSADPTVHDLNGDAMVDWLAADVTGFDSSQLVDGAWEADRVTILESSPAHDFAARTEIDVTMRATSPGNLGAVLMLEADRSGSTFARLRLYAEYVSDGEQKITLDQVLDIPDVEALVTTTIATSALIPLRLLIDPKDDTVALVVDGEHVGTFPYLRTTDGSVPPRGIRLFGSNADAEFDHVDVRVGGWSTTSTNTHPRAVVDASLISAAAGDVIWFDARDSNDPDGDPLHFAWDLGDGTTAEGERVSHTYASDGLYSAVLTVTDGRGGIDVETVTVFISTTVGAGGD